MSKVGDFEIKSKSHSKRIGKFFWELLKFLVSIACLVILVFLFFQLKIVYEKFNTIMELQAIIKNLRANTPVAGIKLLEKIDDFSTVEIYFYDGKGNKIPEKKQVIKIKGEEIRVQCMVYNFSYSLIETGETENFAIPIAVYSEALTSSDFIPLENTDFNSGVPYVLKELSNFKGKAIKELESERLAKLLDVINDEEKSKALGIIRSSGEYAVGNEFKLKQNKEYKIIIQQTGGITLSY